MFVVDDELQDDKQHEVDDGDTTAQSFFKFFLDKKFRKNMLRILKRIA